MRQRMIRTPYAHGIAACRHDVGHKGRSSQDQGQRSRPEPLRKDIRLPGDGAAERFCGGHILVSGLMAFGADVP
jgi:hypothetical protein